MATTDLLTTGPASSDGSPASDLRLQPPTGQARRRRVSWIAAGAVVMLAAAVFGAATIARVADRVPVLALAQPIERGQQLTPAHLTSVRVAADDTITLMPADRTDTLVGRVAASSLPAGTLLTPDLFTSGPALAPNEQVVGLALGPGSYPTATLAPGDRVLVVRTPSTAPSASGANARTATLGEGEVYAVDLLSEASHTYMVSIAVDQSLAVQVAAAASQDRVRLILEGPQ